MKTLLIFIMALVLVGGSYLSKPSEQSFKDLIHKKVDSGEKDDLLQLILHGGKGKADVFLQGCKFNDHILWMDVERDGKTIYRGAFSTWFANDLKIEKAS